MSFWRPSGRRRAQYQEMTGRLSMMKAIKRAVSPKPQRSHPGNGNDSTPVTNVQETPLTSYICSRLRGENLKLFALMFAEAIKNDRHAKVILFENVFKFLGYDLYQHAVRQLKKLFPGELPTPPENLTTRGEVSSNTRGPLKDTYLISVRQFETMMLAAKTEEGARAREMMLDVKDAVQDYMKMEMEASAVRASTQLEEKTTRLVQAEQEKAALAIQLKNLKEAKSYLYAFWLFDNRYKCGITDNPEKREKQHRTSCPSGRMVHTVIIACKQSEKLLDSIMKKHGNHVKQEEYEIEGGEMKVRLILDTVARVEESLHSVPFDKYEGLLRVVNEFLDPLMDDSETSADSNMQSAVMEEDASISQIEACPAATVSSSSDMTEEQKTRDIESFIEKYLRLKQDRRDPRFYVLKTPLYDHYLKACNKEKRGAMRNQCFSKIARDLLDDHYKGGGSNRDQHYIGIELITIPPDSPEQHPSRPSS